MLQVYLFLAGHAPFIVDSRNGASEIGWFLILEISGPFVPRSHLVFIYVAGSPLIHESCHPDA